MIASDGMNLETKSKKQMNAIIILAHPYGNLQE